MSLPPRIAYCVPDETARVTRAIFPDGNLYMRWYDTFGTLFEDRDFAALFSTEGQPGPVPYAIVFGITVAVCGRVIRSANVSCLLRSPSLYAVNAAPAGNNGAPGCASVHGGRETCSQR
jgi:hypothetical protein